MNIFIKNNEGKPSVSLTMVVVSFGIVVLWLVGWLVGATFALPVPPFDALSAMSFLVPILSLYFSRKFTSKTDLANKTSDIGIDAGSNDTANH